MRGKGKCKKTLDLQVDLGNVISFCFNGIYRGLWVVPGLAVLGYYIEIAEHQETETE